MVSIVSAELQQSCDRSDSNLLSESVYNLFGKGAVPSMVSVVSAELQQSCWCKSNSDSSSLSKYVCNLFGKGACNLTVGVL